jgi:DNA-directed RNA polymerase subunit alpha
MNALKDSARILVTHLRLIAGITDEPETTVEEVSLGIPGRVYDIPIEDLGLSVRVFNALKRAGVSKVGEVLDMMGKGSEVILTVRNFGDKSLNELKERLQELGYLEYMTVEEPLQEPEDEEEG